jgi:hypothetical protein
VATRDIGLDEKKRLVTELEGKVKGRDEIITKKDKEI